MATITNIKEFKAALESLSDEEQRVLGARFIAEVLDLAGDAQLKDLQSTATKRHASAEELLNAYHIARSVAIELSLHGDFELIDFKKQAAHFVAKACSACLAPIPSAIKENHRAWNVAHYCREARICAEIGHEKDTEILLAIENDLQKVITKQYALASDFLARP